MLFQYCLYFILRHLLRVLQVIKTTAQIFWGKGSGGGGVGGLRSIFHLTRIYLLCYCPNIELKSKEKEALCIHIKCVYSSLHNEPMVIIWSVKWGSYLYNGQ